MLGAAANVVGNILLIPLYGSMGAAFSTLLSYLLIWGVRAIHTRSILCIQLKLPNLLLGVQCAMMELNLSLWPLGSSIIFVLVAAVNAKPLIRAARRAL